MTSQNQTVSSSPSPLPTVADLRARHPELPQEVAYYLLHFITDARRMGWAYNESEEAARLLDDSRLPE